MIRETLYYTLIANHFLVLILNSFLEMNIYAMLIKWQHLIAGSVGIIRLGFQDILIILISHGHYILKI